MGYMNEGGFIYNFDPATYSASSFTVVDDLQSNNWIDKRTNSIAISFAIFSTTHHTVSAVIMEMRTRSNGLFKDHVEVRSIRDNYYKNPVDFFRLFLEIVYTILFLYYAVVEIIEIKDEYRKQQHNYEVEIRTLEEK